MESVDFLNIQYIFYQIYLLIFNFDISLFWNRIVSVWPIVTQISFYISALLLFGVVNLFFKKKKLEKIDEEKYKTVFVKGSSEDSSVVNERWLGVLKHLESENQSEWKAAILEADIILDEMVKKMGYHGESLGERLKGVEKSDFLTIDQAWEAHKIRNIIAHEGSSYVLSKREAKRAIDLYRQVFKEFNFI